MKNPKKPIFLICLGLAACFLLTRKAISQTTLVTIEGIVSDEEGGILPGAEVTLRNMGTGYIHSTTTRTDGRYIISGIQPGKYEVQASISGFATQRKEGLIFNISANLKVDFTLPVTTLKEEITVTAPTPMVEVTKSEVSTIVDRQKIEDLPLLDRNFADLTILKAGVVGGVSGGLPVKMEEVLVDGMSNLNIIQNANRISAPADAVQEFRVMTNLFQAEYGNTSGMIRSAITRSGTNDFSGRLAYFYRDEILDTPNYFVNHEKYEGKKLPKDQWEKAEFEHHNLTGFIGGPILKDKAHFFFAYEGLRRTTYDTITSPLVPRESVEVPQRNNQFFLKLNCQLSEKHLLSSRLTYESLFTDNVGVGGLYTKERAYQYEGIDFEIQLNWTFFISDNVMNEFRFLHVIDDHNSDPLPEFADKYSIVRPSGFFGKHSHIAQYNFATRYQFVDNFTFFLGNHAFKSGFDFMYNPSGVSVFDMYVPGEYQFLTDKPFDPSDPTTYPFVFITNTGDPAFLLRCHQAGIFVQDSWRIHPKLTFNYGLRYNWYKYTGLGLDNGLRNLNPRFGFSWDPFGDGKTAIRGGAGTYTANVMANIAFPAEFYKPGKVVLTRIYNPGYPDPFQPNPFVPSDEAPIGFDEYEIGLAPSPVSLQTTLGFQRELFTDFSAGIDFIWTRGFSMVTWENKNPIIPGTRFVRPDPNRGNVWYITNRGKSDYKGLYLAINKRYSHGWSLDVAYTFGKAMGNTVDQDPPWSNEEDAWDRAYGRQNNDARHQLAVSSIVDIPLGFQLGGLILYRSAFPWNAVYPYDENLDGLSWDYVDYNRNSRQGFDMFCVNARISKYLKLSKFSLQLFGEIYNLTNRANFYSVFNRFGLDGFGEPQSAYDPRLIQLGARFNF